MGVRIVVSKRERERERERDGEGGCVVGVHHDNAPHLGLSRLRDFEVCV